MSRLPNAPLIEVIFELRWAFDTAKNENSYTFMLGDLYHQLKGSFPYRENINPLNIPLEWMVNRPQVRFRSSENDYPLVQIGPGILTYNVTDPKYDSTNFKDGIYSVVQTFLDYKTDLVKSMASLSLQYYDFYALDLVGDNVSEFLMNKLHTNLSHSFLPEESKMESVNTRVEYTHKGGQIVLSIANAEQNGVNGILVIILYAEKVQLDSMESIRIWTEKAHKICQNLFAEMTAGELQITFNHPQHT